ncbi:MAG: NPCBM/NEW2 domain-containing protein [Nakamurella sp.]
MLNAHRRADQRLRRSVRIGLTAALIVVAAITSATAATALSAPSAAASVAKRPPASSHVRQIDWSRFRTSPPTDAASVTSRRILLNTNKYALQTWYPTAYGSQTGQYLNLGGISEQQIRQPASEALALAISLKTGGYDPSRTGVSTAAATAITLRLITSLAHHHLANTAGGWGDDWQTALWAYFAGSAGWLMWDDLDSTERQLVQNMVTHEADRFIDYQVPYFQDRTGKVIYPGDTKAEENAWNADVLQLATSMMPNGPHWALWMRKNLELMISAFSRPSDLTNREMVNGERVSDWLNGSNIYQNGTLTNHNIIHPDYMATIEESTSAPLSYALAGLPTPKAAFFNAAVVYSALVDDQFSSPPYAAPGGTMYVQGPHGEATKDIYYPQGNDWGTNRRAHFALLDAQASLFGFGAGTDGPTAAQWEAAQNQEVLDMQSRFPDGQTYGATSEDTYAGREQWVAVMAAQNYETHWLAHSGPIRVTNRPYPSTVSVSIPGQLLLTGDSATVTATGTVSGAAAVTGLGFSIAVPTGWRVVPVTRTGWPVARPGQTATASWMVTPKAGASPAGYPIDVTTSYSSLGRRVMQSKTTIATIPARPPTGTSWITDLKQLSGTNGYGPFGIDKTPYNAPLRLRGTDYAKGLWTNPPASIVYYLGGSCTSFDADVGIDDAMIGAPRGATATFQVRLDGIARYDSGLLTTASPVQHVHIDTSGGQQIELVSGDGGDGHSYDWADWAAGRITC